MQDLFDAIFNAAKSRGGIREQNDLADQCQAICSALHDIDPDQARQLRALLLLLQDHYAAEQQRQFRAGMLCGIRLMVLSTDSGAPDSALASLS